MIESVHTRADAQTQESAADTDHGAATEEYPEVQVEIDNLDPVSTVLTIRFGSRLGNLADTVQALNNLGLNISRAQMERSEGHRFYITDATTGNKILNGPPSNFVCIVCSF